MVLSLKKCALFIDEDWPYIFVKFKKNKHNKADKKIFINARILKIKPAGVFQ
jgi:hypothetical protein